MNERVEDAKCPKCGSELEDTHENLVWTGYYDAYLDLNCPKCEKTVRVSVGFVVDGIKVIE